MNKISVKIGIVILLLFLCVKVSMAVVIIAFSSWDFLIQKSPDIVIARCSQTPDPDRDRGAGPTGALVYSDIEIISILKGATNWGGEPLKAPSFGAARMSSEYYPRQGEYYLIFSIYYHGEYQASEDYRVIPLGLTFYTNSLSGKKLDEQIQILLQHRLNNLNRQMKNEQEEKQRLEEGIQ